MKDEEKKNLLAHIRRIEDKIESSMTENYVLIKTTTIFGIKVKVSTTHLQRRTK